MSTRSGVQSVTTAPESLEAEQRARIRQYLVTMGIRTACFVLAVILSGWMRWTAVALAIVLPYVAVVFANAVRVRPAGSLNPVTPVIPQIPAGGPEPLRGEVVDPPESPRRA